MGLKADPADRWPRGSAMWPPLSSGPRGRRLCSLPFGAAYRWELVSGGYAPCGHIHHPRYVRNGHTAEGCPPRRMRRRAGGCIDAHGEGGRATARGPAQTIDNYATRYMIPP